MLKKKKYLFRKLKKFIRQTCYEIWLWHWERREAYLERKYNKLVIDFYENGKGYYGKR